MAGIAGVAKTGKTWLVNCMLDRIIHRGSAGREVIETPLGTMGVTWLQPQAEAGTFLAKTQIALDESGPGHFALVDGAFTLKRDLLGVAPLYYGQMADGILCFASEVKALLEATRQVMELPPGHIYNGSALHSYESLRRQEPVHEQPENIARELRRKLELAVEKRISKDEMGVWLSGGLDSSIMAALARPHLHRLDTFAVGLPGAPDLEYARIASRFLKCKHHEITVLFKEMLAVLPTVIYHLESFDALLVRSSVMNFLVAKRAAGYVLEVFSGEGGDELFAGYEYLKSLESSKLTDELVDITMRLHNTALQRVDRCASAHGLVAHVAFLDPEVVDYAFRIPVADKLHNGVEKWILRQAMTGALPDPILNRPKSKFWQGAGVEELFARYAEENVTDAGFNKKLELPNGWCLDSKEELFYYRIFHQYFGKFKDLSWMVRTKGAPIS